MKHIQYEYHVVSPCSMHVLDLVVNVSFDTNQG